MPIYLYETRLIHPVIGRMVVVLAERTGHRRRRAEGCYVYVL